MNEINAIVKALGYTENGGKPTVSKKGKTGELKSIFQFEPGTWANYSKQVFGKEVPLTPDTETHVVQQKVSKWLQSGYTPSQIASMWNAGIGEPDAYTGKFSDGTSSTGVNKKYGVAYNVPEYVDKFNNYLKEFSSPTNTESIGEKQPAQTSSQPKSSNGLQQILSMMQQAKSPQQNTPPASPQQGQGNPGLLT